MSYICLNNLLLLIVGKIYEWDINSYMSIYRAYISRFLQDTDVGNVEDSPQ